MYVFYNLACDTFPNVNFPLSALPFLCTWIPKTLMVETQQAWSNGLILRTFLAKQRTLRRRYSFWRRWLRTYHLSDRWKHRRNKRKTWHYSIAPSVAKINVEKMLRIPGREPQYVPYPWKCSDYKVSVSLHFWKWLYGSCTLRHVQSQKIKL